MREQFSNIEKFKNEIRDVRQNQHNYNKAINLCKNLLDVLKVLNDVEYIETKWFCYHNMALCHYKLEKYDIAIKNELLALNNISNNDNHYALSVWEIAECYKNSGNYKEAVKLYDESARAFKLLGDKKKLSFVLWNKAYIIKNMNAMFMLIKIHLNRDLNEVYNSYGAYDDALTEMFEQLFDLYILENKLGLAYKLLSMLKKDSKLRKELSLKLVA